MKDTLITLLQAICPNVYLQGTLSDDGAYPENFITIWVNDAPDNAHYDNDVHSIDWYFSIIYYSSNPSNVNTVPAQIRAALKSAGFIPQGRGNDIPSDVPTHTGWAMDYIYTEIL